MKVFMHAISKNYGRIFYVCVLILFLNFFTIRGSSALAGISKAYFHEQEDYQLNESHKKNSCSSCHSKSQRRREKRRDCGSCHTPRHDLPTGSACKGCHTLKSFSRIKPYRHILNDFFRVGVHKTLSCRECHPQGRFRGNSNQCVHCHMERRQDAPHGMKLGGDCSQCHTPFGWQPVNFHHPAFSLRAAHRNLNCLDCHPGYEFKSSNSYCYTCHKKEFHGGSGFDHAAAALPYDCLLCHTINSFAPPASYSGHPDGLIRLGNHRNADCLDCHKQPIFRGLSEECRGCHQHDYDVTTAPNHAANGFPPDCQLCHSPSDFSWEEGGENHTWPLRGTHQTLSCLQCHNNGVYMGKSTECYSCHRTDYEGAQNPNHGAAGFPTACDGCHQDSHTSWQEAIFNHPFPLSNDHTGLVCIECHSNPGSYTIFVCTDCHAHQQQEMNFLHRTRGVSGYIYNSHACYFCHPQGQA